MDVKRSVTSAYIPFGRKVIAQGRFHLSERVEMLDGVPPSARASASEPAGRDAVFAVAVAAVAVAAVAVAAVAGDVWTTQAMRRAVAVVRAAVTGRTRRAACVRSDILVPSCHEGAATARCPVGDPRSAETQGDAPCRAPAW
ncbi:hypothetical protein GCM10010260_05490 [Streptomyces filipinensis]|uniref:Uncharacterized protein n=1 Tax=Streptomyces filipinensis TaxID=66887 RepID=A0A918M968_9ACTN|nr:hypothetical protein GCM10010260_05490 [Streptomyces filipinensis]